MSNYTLTKRLALVVCAFTVVGLLGCTGGGATGLPETVIVELPDGTETEVSMGAGVISLANTSWAFRQVFTGGAISGTSFLTITFGPEGELASFENNTIASEIFGDSILFDGVRHETSQQGLSYAAATYGAETSDASGFAFVGELNAFAPILGKVATATANASGEFDPEDPDVMTGTFTFEGAVLVELPGVPTDPFEDVLDFIAERVE